MAAPLTASAQHGRPQLAHAARRHDAAAFICTVLFAFLGGAVEGLRYAFERKGIGRLRTFGGNALDHGTIAAPHGIDHFGLFGGVFDPGAVLLGIEREARPADLYGSL